MHSKELYQSIAHTLPLFFKPWWLDIVCVGSWELAIAQRQSEIIAVWPYQLERKYGFTLLRNPSLTAYLGPYILSDNLTEIQLEDCLKEMWEQIPNASLKQWTSYPRRSNFNYKRLRKLEEKKKQTFIIDLHHSEEDLWNKIHPKRKNDIRKADQDLIVEKAPLDIEPFIQWHSASFEKKNKKYPYTSDFLKNLIHKTEEQKASVTYQAKDKSGNLLGQIWLVFDQDTMYYLLSAAPPENTHRGAISLLLWEAIKMAQKMGLQYFDFEGSIDPGIAQFFEKFGGERISYTEYVQTNSLLWQLKTRLMG